MAHDLIIRNGTVVDGTGRAGYVADVAIDGALVGGASLKPDEMAGIVGRAGVTGRARRAASRRQAPPRASGGTACRPC